MENVYYRQPSKYQEIVTSPQGNTTTNESSSSSHIVIRESTGFTGKLPSVRPLPIHDYSLLCYRARLDHVARYNYFNGQVVQYRGPVLYPAVNGGTYDSQYDITSLRNRALDKLNDKVRGGLDLAVDIAEAGKTLKMLRLSEQVVDLTSTFVRRFGVIKVASKAWLAYQYGVKPLLNSIYGLAEENIRVVINETERFRVRATDSSWRPNGIWLMNANTMSSNLFPFSGGTQKCSYTIGMDLRTDQHDISRFSSLNPVSLAWELLPLSFVADWFLNVGGYLRNLETYLINNNKFRSGYETFLAVGDHSINWYRSGGPLPEWGISGYTNTYQGTVKSMFIQRKILNSYPAPTLPSFKAVLGSSRLLSAASLLGVMLSSGGNPKKRQSWLDRDVNERIRTFQPKSNVSVWNPDYNHL